MSDKPPLAQIKVRIVKAKDKPDREKERERYISNHKDSLLSLLIEENPERAIYFLRKLSLTRTTIKV